VFFFFFFFFFVFLGFLEYKENKNKNKGVNRLVAKTEAPVVLWLLLFPLAANIHHLPSLTVTETKLIPPMLPMLCYAPKGPNNDHFISPSQPGMMQ